ncbi:hypothetical protein HHUSO_G4096 [Huso huso]|uniref:Uncharacterized protein n=1 Tax=Huso huso TaxID=61971 RepID=A0ABR1A484_HUSHU
MSHTFQNPQKRVKSAKKQIYVADVDDNSKIDAYTSVHATITEGLGVCGVANLVKEYMNSADDFTICDSKGLEIVDSFETKDVEFWKIPSRKVYAFKCDLMKIKQKHESSVAKRKRNEDATDRKGI